MSLSAIPKTVRRLVFARANGRCQYCQLAQIGQAAVFHVNHIVPRSKGGSTDESNLALQCPYCSFRKADKTTACDPANNQVALLFHPLRQSWREHFAFDAVAHCFGLTPAGRATVAALGMNDPLPLLARRIQMQVGILTASDSSEI
jgi:HNH endonuclease